MEPQWRASAGESRCRKITKTRASFPTDDAIMKLFYLAIRNICPRENGEWTMPVPDWKAALNRFTILFGDRMPGH